MGLSCIKLCKHFLNIFTFWLTHLINTLHPLCSVYLQKSHASPLHYFSYFRQFISFLRWSNQNKASSAEAPQLCAMPKTLLVSGLDKHTYLRQRFSTGVP